MTWGWGQSDVSEGLRLLADRIDSGKYDFELIRFKIVNDVEEGEPESDDLGQRWATWKYTGVSTYDIKFKLTKKGEGEDAKS